MKPEIIFSIVNTIALVSWIVLAVAPRWFVTRKIILSGAMSLLLSVIYLVLIIMFWGSSDGGFDTLANVMKLFANENVALAAWVHYLAFDLFVGAWEVKDAQQHKVSHWFVVPCLLLTFMLGPIGFLIYHVIRFAVLQNRKGATQ